MATTGVVTQVIGSTFDAQFPEDQLPDIYNAIRVATEGVKGGLVERLGQGLDVS